ncbi:MAG: isoprenylcysteine carboxylmethyltransferase family protein [Thermoanaerobaculia bacterium]
MTSFLRHLIAFLALPFVMTVLIPLSMLRGSRSTPLAFDAMGRFTPYAIGVLLFVVGLSLFSSSLFNFVTRGRGTLAPWDPPKNLVVAGPYRHVRNPMISGVIFILFAEGFLFQSRSLLLWAVTFLLINAIYIPLFEEPTLADRFGDPYREYCRHVPALRSEASSLAKRRLAAMRRER